MRGGLSAIQQTLTPEAATVLTQSISESARRNHGQTTPLHVAATLLSSPTGFLRQACIRSHPNSSHPLQCRALELCFTVALDRLPSAQSTAGEPPISNALMAALKRAQAHQRRGCPEQQQQPLLAVKVELEQLIISILDDPSVSRVMREASFSSPAVKAAIEHVITSRANPGPRLGPGPAPGGRNLYLNPRLQHQPRSVGVGVAVGMGMGMGMRMGVGGRGDDVKRVMEILSRGKKRNPVLVGELEPGEVVKEVLKNVEIHEGVLKNVEVVSMDKEIGVGIGLDFSQMSEKVRELGGLIERKMLLNSRGGSGVVLDLGDLKWLVDQPGNQAALEAARGVVTEMGKLLSRFGEENTSSHIWLIGTATCETYLRCQVYHPTMENEWDLQVVPIVARPTIPGILPRLGSNGGILSSSIEAFSPMMKSFPMGAQFVTKNSDPWRRSSSCRDCTEKCSEEVAQLAAEKSPSDDVVDATRRQSLPPWLQNAKLHANDNILQGDKDEDLILRQKTQELQKKWSENCLKLHPNFHHNVSSERIVPSPLSMMSLYNPKLQQPRNLGDGLQLGQQQLNPDRRTSPPASPVRTDLNLGRPKPGQPAQDEVHKERLKDFLGCISSESSQCTGSGRPVTVTATDDVDSYKRVLKGLMEKVWWQREAASGVASAITQSKLGNGKRRAGGGSIWLLFSGPDRTGKKKTAAAISELVYGVSSPILISLGARRYGDESDMDFRGKTAIDRIVEAVRRNPVSVIMLQDIDEADMVVQGSIKRAMERGRLVDSHGREVSLGNVIFILTSSWVPNQLKGLSHSLNEDKLTSLASGGWQLRLSLGEKKPTGKRPPPNWLIDHTDDDQDLDRSIKHRKESGPGLGLSFDLNQTAYSTEDDRLDGSNNSSDLTVDHEDEHTHDNRGSPTSSTPYELFGSVDKAIVFKPVDFTPIRHKIDRTISAKWSALLGDNKVSLKIENEALERILCGMWLGQTLLDNWVEKVLVPSINQVKTKLPSLLPRSPDPKMVARLELDKELESRSQGDWLPAKISVVVADAQ